MALQLRARAAYRSVAAESHDEATFERWLDFCILRGVLHFHGGGTVGSEQASAAIADYLKIADCERAEPLVRAHAEHALCIAYNKTARFGAAIERVERARSHFAASGYGRMMVEIQLGHAAMARGQAAAARDCYAAAMRVAKASYPHEPVWTSTAAVLLRELDLERSRIAPSSRPPGIPAALTRNGTPAQAYAAAADVAVGRALAETGPESALVLLDAMAQFVRGARLAPLATILAAMRVSLLVDTGAAGDAERAWYEQALPGDTGTCLDLEGQTWREMEALNSAWLRLSIDHDRFDEARAFAAELRAAAGTRGLRRRTVDDVLRLLDRGHGVDYKNGRRNSHARGRASGEDHVGPSLKTAVLRRPGGSPPSR